MVGEAAPPAPVSDYLVHFEVDRPEKQSRFTNFPLGVGTFIRFILLMPHFVILYFFQLAAGIMFLIGSVAILFSGRYPEGLFRFYVAYTRWSSNAYGYVAHVYDAYPPFNMDPQPGYPLRFDVDYPAQLSRLLNFPVLGVIVKFILAIPHFLILPFLAFAAFVVVFLAQFAILFTGSFPIGMHKFVVGVGRWSTRVNAYVYALTDKYPPFSLN